MQFLVNVPDKKARLMQDILESISFAEVAPLTTGKAKHLRNLLEAIDELHAIKAGKRKAVPLKKVLDELRG